MSASMTLPAATFWSSLHAIDRPGERPKPHLGFLMRWGVGAIILLLLAAVAYTAWPLINLYQVAAAVRSSDTVAFLQRVDLPAVRKSIARQILDRASEGKITGVKMSVNPAGREIAANLLEAKLEDVITPEMLFDILRRGRASGGAGVAPSGPGSGPSPNTLPSNPLSRLKSLSFPTPSTFQVSLGEGNEPNDWLTLILILRPPMWKLSGVKLPDTVFDRFQRKIHIEISGAK
jgi:hypothetical protein